MNEQPQMILSERDQVWRNDVIAQVAKETRLPIPRVMMLEWNQFQEPNKIRTKNGREVELSKLTASALLRLPCAGRYIFSMSPFPPTIPDEYLDPAREFIGKDRKKRRHLTIAWR